MCVIQDGVEDKLSEMERIGAIYRNAVVTIAVLHARKASEGFLKVARDYKPGYCCKMLVNLLEKPGVSKVILAADSLGARYPEPPRTRGWAFQEAVLSGRFIILSGYYLQCHCDLKHQGVLNLGNLTRAKSPDLFASGVKHFD